MTDIKMTLAAALKRVDELLSEKIESEKRITALEGLLADSINDAQMYQHLNLLPTCKLSMLCFEHTQGSGSLTELVKISMGKK